MPRKKKDEVTAQVVKAPRASNSLIDQMQTLGAEELGILLRRSTKSIRVDSVRRPWTLPPRLVIDGTRKLLWTCGAVCQWMADLQEWEANRRAEAERVSRKTGIKLTPRGKLVVNMKRDGGPPKPAEGQDPEPVFS